MRLIEVEPLDLEPEGGDASWVTPVSNDLLNEVLHVVSARDVEGLHSGWIEPEFSEFAGANCLDFLGDDVHKGVLRVFV